MFPSGWPGIALLLLRASAAADVFLYAYGCQDGCLVWVYAGLIAVAAALCAGIFTPMVAVITLAIQLVRLISLGTGRAGALISMLDTLALSLLGPGAYSVDAFLFGRRVVVLAPKDDPESN